MKLQPTFITSVIIVILSLALNTWVFAEQVENLDDQRQQLIYDLQSSVWNDESDVESSLRSINGGMGTLAAKSCSSKDGNKDCFCDGGCWRTSSDCGCTATGIGGGLYQPGNILSP